MSREEAAIFTNMCMISDKKGKILVQDRRAKDWPGITFPGGHVEKKESFVQSVKREILEETGLKVRNLQLCGIKQFQTKTKVRYVVLLYKTSDYTGRLKSSKQGKVFWIPREDLNKYKLATDFKEMVEVMESPSLSEFYYEGKQVNLL